MGGPRPRRLLSDRDGHHRGQGAGPALRIPRIGHIALVAHRVEFLPEIACAADQCDENDWQIEIGRSAGSIPGQDSEPAAIGRHFRSDRDFHREVGDPGPAYEAIMVDAAAWLRIRARRWLVHGLTVSVCG